MGKIKDYPLDSGLIGDEKLLSSDSDDSTVNITVNQLKTFIQVDISGKQDTLVSTVNIKSINGNTILGSGNLAVGDALIANPLSQFAATTSSQLAGVISDETGGGALVFATSPTLVTPTLGVALATSINGVTINTGVLSGTNTGDQSSIVGITGTKAQFDTAVTDGNIMYIGDAPTSHTHTESDITDLQTYLLVADINTFAELDTIVADKALVNKADGGVFASDISVPDEVYGAPWNGSLEVPTKNAVYDKIETLGGGGDMVLATVQTSTGKKTFQADATNAGINIGGVTADPSSPSDGDVWYRSDLVKYFTRGSGVTDSIVMSQNNATLTNKGISLANNTITGTKAQFDTACSDGNFMYIGDAPTSHTHTESDITDLQSYITASSTDTLTNKTFDANGTGNSLLNLPVEIGVAISDETTDLTTGTAKVTLRMPYAMTLTEVRANVNTAPTGATITVDINESGTTVLSTKLTIDATEKTSETAATAPVISDSALADDAEITIDIDQIGSTIAGKGLKIWLIGTRA